MNAPLPPEPDPVFGAEERRLQQLFSDGEADYLDDAGFTARVLGRLPAARRQRERRRLLLVGGALLLGGALAGLFGGHELVATLADGWSLLAEWSARPIPGLETLATVGSLVVLVGALSVAWWSRREA